MSQGINFQSRCSCSSMNEYHSNDCDYFPGMRMSKLEGNKFIEPDPVNPSHYVSQGQYSALHVVQKWGLGFCLGNALKYISRAGKKPGESEITDLKKAIWYIRRHIHELDPKEPDPAAPENRP